MSNIIWQNLKELKCPKCYKDLIRNNYNAYNCEDIDCTFGITELKLREIAEPMFEYPSDPFGRESFEELIEASKK